jgi:hypothetical protein
MPVVVGLFRQRFQGDSYVNADICIGLTGFASAPFPIVSSRASVESGDSRIMAAASSGRRSRSANDAAVAESHVTARRPMEIRDASAGFGGNQRLMSKNAFPSVASPEPYIRLALPHIERLAAEHARRLHLRRHQRNILVYAHPGFRGLKCRARQFA